MTSPLSAPYLFSRLRLRQVALLLELDRGGTLRAAAAELGITQPAATNMLKELESALGMPLFERQGRGLRATAAGVAVMAHCQGLRGAMTAMGRELDGMRGGDVGTLAVGSILAPSPTLLTRTVAQIKREQPGLRLSILTETSDHLLGLLRQGVLDVVIGRMTEGHAHRDHVLRELESEALSVVVGPNHPLAAPTRRRRDLLLADLQHEPWVLQPRPSPMREVLEAEFKLCGLDRPQNLVETSSILTTIFLLGEAPMVAVVPSSLAARYAAKAMVRVLPVQLTSALEPYSSIVRRGLPLSAAASRFLDLLHGAAGARRGKP